MQYHIWTLGCQMNVADTQRLASELEHLGHHAAVFLLAVVEIVQVRRVEEIRARCDPGGVEDHDVDTAREVLDTAAERARGR